MAKYGKRKSMQNAVDTCADAWYNSPNCQIPVEPEKGLMMRREARKERIR
jgi:hypothetical protein